MSKTLEEKVARSPLPKKDGRKKRRVAKPLPQEDTNSAPKTIDTILFEFEQRARQNRADLPERAIQAQAQNEPHVDPISVYEALTGWTDNGEALRHPDGFHISYAALSGAGEVIAWCYRLRNDAEALQNFLLTLDSVCVARTGQDLELCYGPLKATERGAQRVTRVDLQGGTVSFIDTERAEA